MSKEKALANMSEFAIGNMLADIPAADALHGFPDGEAVVRAYQKAKGLPVDGWPGHATMSRLWQDWKPSPKDIVTAALKALGWSPVVYGQHGSSIGRLWLEDWDCGAEEADCGDFVAHCLGIPEEQRPEWGALYAGRELWKCPKAADGRVWLSAAAYTNAAVGHPRPWHMAKPGDIMAYGQHVEVCVEVVPGGPHGFRIITVGVSASAGRKGNAVAKQDRTSLWAKKKAVAVTPWWNL